MQKRYKKIRGVSIIVMLGLKNTGIDLQPQILERCQEEKEIKKFCNDFVVYMSRGLSIERIHFDEEHWKKHRAMEECLAQHLEGAGPAL